MEQPTHIVSPQGLVRPDAVERGSLLKRFGHGHAQNLTGVPKQQLREMGWTKARELAKVARKGGGSKVHPGAQGPGAPQGRIQAGGRTAPNGEAVQMKCS